MSFQKDKTVIAYDGENLWVRNATTGDAMAVIREMIFDCARSHYIPALDTPELREFAQDLVAQILDEFFEEEDSDAV